MDDKKQAITLSMFHYYHWNDSRIIVNSSHNYWDPDDNGYKLAMSGEFVAKCLWIPKLSFTNIAGLSSWHSTPTESAGPPMDFYLSRKGQMEVVKDRFHVTIACPMDFSKYPFDAQVIGLKIFNVVLG